MNTESKVLRVHEQARNAFLRLDAEEPGRAEEELRAVETAIGELSGCSRPVGPVRRGAPRARQRGADGNSRGPGCTRAGA
ncbi:hypothetical protein GCM10010508_12910 [Streptomyces naganishii JCM 4654]|uniref:Uncharacterized protein n=1 Tax=Streptomyces naganishii JCM 4654 TaxID=1306179 RepID=A0A919CTX4_9ACTN|nr:hypothetical protein GCM10010508_12910 [Streptomyces naganishii JCM 4654]